MVGFSSIIVKELRVKAKESQLIDIEPSWNKVLEEELRKPYLKELSLFLQKERASGTPIYPPKDLVFNAFKHTPYDKVKVVIMGQDPYHGPGQAHGLSFSVPDGVKPPPSLKNIFKELVNDVGIEMPTTGNLIPWADQGVMLLNATLTVRKSNANSHQKKGWEQFTDAVIAKLCARKDPIIFVLWGNSAKRKMAHVQDLQTNSNHTVLAAAHPSPLSAYNGFFGCRHFSQINKILENQNKSIVNWSLN